MMVASVPRQTTIHGMLHQQVDEIAPEIVLLRRRGISTLLDPGETDQEEDEGDHRVADKGHLVAVAEVPTVPAEEVRQPW